MNLRLRHLFLCLPLCIPSAFAEGEADIISDSALDGPMKEMIRQLRVVKDQELPLERLIETYDRRARAAATKRQEAIEYFLLGYLYQIARRDRDALAAFEQARRAFPRFPADYVALARLAIKGRDVDRARALLKKALTIDPDHLESLLMLAELALLERDFDRALQLFERANDTEINAVACAGIARARLVKYSAEVLEEKKAEEAAKALRAARACVRLQPKNYRFRVLRAQIYLALGRVKDAADVYEEALRLDFPEKARVDALVKLLDIYAQSRDVEGALGVCERFIALEGVRAEERDRMKQIAADLRRYGPDAFIIANSRAMLSVLSNTGIDIDARRNALQLSLRFFVSEEAFLSPAFQEVRGEVREAMLNVLTDKSAAELVGTMLEAFRDKLKSPRLIRIVSHFLYPEEERESIRVEAAQAIGAVAGVAALPSLFYSLKDDSGLVARQVDNALSAICQARASAPAGIEPLSREEVIAARAYWRRYRRSAAGAERLVEAYEKLAEYALTDREGKRQHAAAHPLLRHTVSVVLLDDDIAWPAWGAAYRFFVAQQGLDFRPADRRGEDLLPGERKGIVAALDRYWSAPAEEAAARKE